MWKNVVPWIAEPIPKLYDFLPEKNLFKIGKEVPVIDKIVFILDCGDIKRSAVKFAYEQEPIAIVNIDHHLDNSRFGTFNLVDEKASSTSELIYQLIFELKTTISPAMAVNLYTGIVTDTGSFQYSNTTPKCLRIASQLVSEGADPQNIALAVYNQKNKSYIKLLEQALNKMEFFYKDKIAVLIVTQEMLKIAKGSFEDVEDFLLFPRSIIGVEAVIFIKEISDKSYKISLRSKGRVNVANIAAQFDGGGHHNAAGLKFEGDLDQIKQKIIKMLEEHL